jgi:hypothetical protein
MTEVGTIFKDHIEKSSTFKGVSKTIQNELFDSILNCLIQSLQSIIIKIFFANLQEFSTFSQSLRSERQY